MVDESDPGPGEMSSVTYVWGFRLKKPLPHSATNGKAYLKRLGRTFWSAPRVGRANVDKASTWAGLAATTISNLIISACTTSITHQKLGQTDVQTEPGFSYYLPRQRYTVTITYELTRCSSSEDFTVSQSATIVEENEADPVEYYLLTYETIDSSLKTSKFQATTYPNKTLKTVGVTIEDKSAAVIKSATSTAISVAKMILGMPPALREADCNQKTVKALKAVEDAEAKIMDPTVESDARTAAAEAIAHAKNQLRIVHVQRMIPTWSSVGSPISVTLSSDQLAKWFEPNLPAGITELDRMQGGEVATEIVVRPKMIEPPSPRIARAGQGVIYRDPMPTTVKVCRETCAGQADHVLTELATQVSQLGRYMTVTLENDGFDNNNVALNFTPNGALEDMTFDKESSLEEFAASLSDTATQVQGFAELRRKQLEAVEAAEKAAPLNAIEAETALLNAKANRIEAENRLRALGGDPTN
jgi:hypothetical protein